MKKSAERRLDDANLVKKSFMITVADEKRLIQITKFYNITPRDLIYSFIHAFDGKLNDVTTPPIPIKRCKNRKYLSKRSEHYLLDLSLIHI